MWQWINGHEDDGVRNMLDDLPAAKTPHLTPSKNELEETANAFIEMLASSKKPLYEGAKISHLDAILQLLAVKAEYGYR
jgi:hypothetical protein